MNSLERLIASGKDEPLDCVPVAPGVGHYAAYQARQPMTRVAYDPELMADVVLRSLERMLCETTERIVKVSEEELASALMAAPSQLFVGSGKDGTLLKTRTPSDPYPMAFGASLGITVSEETWPALTEGIARQHDVDLLEGGSLTTIHGCPVLPGTPFETLVGYEQGRAHREVMALGGLENEGAFSPEQMVIDNEICCMIGKVLEGIRVDDERLAADLIKEVGPIPGNYLRKEHTRRHWREDYFIPQVSVREGYDAWIAGGRKGALERASEIAHRLMATHQPRPLPPEVDRELDKILKAAEDEKLGAAGS